MHCHCGTNNGAPRWTLTNPCKPEVWSGGVSVSCLASRTRHECQRHNESVYKEANTGCGPTLYKKCHSHNTPGKRHNNTWVLNGAGAGLLFVGVRVPRRHATPVRNIECNISEFDKEEVQKQGLGIELVVLCLIAQSIGDLWVVQSYRKGKLLYTTHATNPILFINFSNMYKRYHALLLEVVRQYLVSY